MAIRISAAHRDALYEQLLDRLSGIGEVWTAVNVEDFEAASRLGWEYSDDLRLILEDLGWGDGPGRSVELSAPSDVLRRVLSRLRETVAAQGELEARERSAARDRQERNRLVAEVCEAVIKGLGDE